MIDKEQHDQDCIFVLWAEQFDEATATIFITEFRRLGLRVKIIGLDGITARGRYGLGLLIDMTLGEAVRLAENAICILVPCQRGHLQRISADPRLSILFALAFAQDECILVTWNDTMPDLIDQYRISSDQFVSLSEDKHTLLGTAEKIGRRLLRKPNK